MTGAGQIGGPGCGVNSNLNGACAVVRRNSGSDSVARVDGFAKRGAILRCVFAGHGTDAQVIEALFGHRQTDQAASVASHEVDRFRSNFFGGQSEVAFVFAIFVVDDDNHYPGADLFDRRRDIGKRGARTHRNHAACTSRGSGGVTSLSALRNRFRIARITQRIKTTITTRKKTTVAPAAMGWRVASHVKDTASTSSPALSAKFEKGSGEVGTLILVS